MTRQTRLQSFPFSAILADILQPMLFGDQHERKTPHGFDPCGVETYDHN